MTLRAVPLRTGIRRWYAFVMCAAATAVLAVSCATLGPLQGDMSIPDTTYISPFASPGVQDALTVPAGFSGYEKIAIRGYRLEIMNDSGAAVYTKADQIGPPGKAPLFQRRKSVKLPEKFSWDGRDDSGTALPDGTYTYTLTGWDAQGNQATVGPYKVVLDDTAPVADLRAGYSVFSPDGDGRLDTLLIHQTPSTSEDVWTGEVKTGDGTTILKATWNGSTTDFTWDGKDQNGARVSDGTYSYVLHAMDRAGNSYSDTINGIVVDTRPTGVSLDLSDTHLSPNGDGVKDTITITPKLVTATGVSAWTLNIYNEDGEVAASRNGTGTVPASFPFDGKGTSGARLADGTYRAELVVAYSSGSEPHGASDSFVIDTEAPYAATSTGYRLFSPDGDGRLDTLPILQSSTTEVTWKGVIVDAAGRTVRSWDWPIRAVAFEWDGKDSAGTTVADGTYSYRLTSTDESGNTGTFAIPGIRVDTTIPTAGISTPAAGPSRNRLGQFDPVAFSLSTSQSTEISKWHLDVTTSSGAVYYSAVPDDPSTLPSSVLWDGRNSAGQTVDGTYNVALTIEYQKGRVVTTKSARPVTIDTSAPTIAVTVSPKPFSPDGDGTADTVSIGIRVTDASSIASWRAAISDPTGVPFRTFTGSGASATITWDGKSSTGELVQSAFDYALAVTATDAFGNSSSVSDSIPVDILVQRDGDRLRIVVAAITFQANTANYLAVPPADARRNVQTLDRLAETLKKYPQYRIRIEGHAVRVFWDQPAKIEAEERDVLVPLSEERAAVIRQALMSRGIDGARMDIAGYGGTRPVVPHGDLVNRWKNRRVEFILVKS